MFPAKKETIYGSSKLKDSIEEEPILNFSYPMI